MHLKYRRLNAVKWKTCLSLELFLKQNARRSAANILKITPIVSK